MALSRWHVDVPADLGAQVTTEPDADPEFDDAEAPLTLEAQVTIAP